MRLYGVKYNLVFRLDVCLNFRMLEEPNLHLCTVQAGGFLAVY